MDKTWTKISFMNYHRVILHELPLAASSIENAITGY